jgi:hypothetical protein
MNYVVLSLSLFTTTTRTKNTKKDDDDDDNRDFINPFFVVVVL